jgi:hypothetical protein
VRNEDQLTELVRQSASSTSLESFRRRVKSSRRASSKSGRRSSRTKRM